MKSDEVVLQRFGQHCRWFYESSLALYPSSRVANDDGTKKKKNENDGKIAIEALDRIVAIHSIVESQQQKNSIINDDFQSSIDNLRHEHSLIAERYRETLTECGLFDINRFTEDNIMNAIHEPTKTNSDEVSCLLQKYCQMRDDTRRRVHNIAMHQRQNALFELLLERISNEDTDELRMTQTCNIQHTISTIKRFVRDYQSNIGSHPFIAGLHRLIQLQLSPPKPDNENSCADPTYIVRWSFRGSVLMEACKSCRGINSTVKNDDLTYARDAIDIIFSFLIWIKDIDLEGAQRNNIIPIDDTFWELDQIIYDEKSEPILSFEVDKYISNATLRRILSVLPDPTYLDARATGSVEILDATSLSENSIQISSNLVHQRKNVDGKEDEQAWFAILDFCTVL